jgi:hypothetical protein
MALNLGHLIKSHGMERMVRKIRELEMELNECGFDYFCYGGRIQ